MGYLYNKFGIGKVPKIPLIKNWGRNHWQGKRTGSRSVLSKTGRYGARLAWLCFLASKVEAKWDQYGWGTRGVLINTVRYDRAVLWDLTWYFEDNSSSSDFGAQFWEIKGKAKRWASRHVLIKTARFDMSFWWYLKLVLRKSLGTLGDLTTGTNTGRDAEYVSYWSSFWWLLKLDIL